MSGSKKSSKPRDQTLFVSKPPPQRDSIRVRKSKLLIVSGPLQGKECMVGKDVFTIGSGDHNDLWLKDSTVSRRHCEIQLGPDGNIIRDLGSTNGTRVQGIKISEAFLDEGTEVQLGETKFVFCPLQESTEYALSQAESYGCLLGSSVPMRRVFHQAETYAPTDATILIEGETGTGKELLAEEIHRHSKRKDKPFIVIDCAALAKDLIQSELFGHLKGAFTGASGDRIGAFEDASGGTVFLDEIGDLSPDLQPKLLRVLEKKQIKRLGSNKVRPVDVRIISATNKSLENEVNAGNFREDLYFRLSVVHMGLAPLRNRKEDIPTLVMKFLEEFHGKAAVKRLENFDKTLDAFNNHDWPGNIRELRNLVEIAFYSKKPTVDLSAFLYLGRMRSQDRSSGIDARADIPFKDAKNELIREFETDYIEKILKRNGGNISKAAREAGIERAYLQRLIRKYGIKAGRSSEG